MEKETNSKQKLSRNLERLEQKIQTAKQNDKHEKDAGNNQWTSTALRFDPDNRDRRDGPGGEDAGIS